MLRAIPNFVDLRPADANETVEAWKFALQHDDGPSALMLTRQNLPTIDRDRYAPAGGIARGAYVLADAEGEARSGRDPDRHRQRGRSWRWRRTSA